MKMTRKVHRFIQVQNIVFYVLFVVAICLLGYLSREYAYQSDWTFGQRNSLTEASTVLLEGIDEPIRFIVYVPDDNALREKLRKLIGKYQKVKPELEFEFVNPDLDPVRAKQDGVKHAGQIVVRLGIRTEIIESTSESVIANALQRMSRGGERLVVFLEGHGERDPLADHSSGMSTLLASLEKSGFRAQPHSFVRSQSVPDNARFLMIAAPQKDLLDGEVEIITRYVKQGGNLIWLRDPGDTDSLSPLAELLGIQFGEGTIVDANEQLHQMLGIDHPAVVPVVDYGRSPIAAKLTGSQSLFPFSTRIARIPSANQSIDWKVDEFLSTLPNSWMETAPIDGEIAYAEEDGDELGPLVIGMAFTRLLDSPENAGGVNDKVGVNIDSSAERQQRVVVVGDSDFMLNAFVGRGANLDLTTNIFNWLAADDKLLNIRSISAPDTHLELDEWGSLVLAVFFLLALPLGLILTGVFIWFRRRRR
uniref:ABC transporter n=1 Tax=uncultured Thiotrichaceae bacterium TaxID=298394 RepID=A0A6S6U5Q6_9GAMM|nr:MAG: ABC transporter [uncultured Thiotrichaceae bacterium]